MFILSAGMPKSSSTLLSLYQKNILEHSVQGNGQKEFEQCVKDGKVNGVGIFVHNLEQPEILQKLVDLSEKIGPFVVKSHLALSASLAAFLVNKQILATYIHRDPRDVILSAMDHGKRPPDHPTMNEFFLQFNTVENSIPLVREFCRTGIEWVESGLCELFRYHDLVVDPERELIRFSSLIHADPDVAYIRDLIRNFTDTTKKWKRQFNTGKILRYADEMSPPEIELCNRELAEELRVLGYQTV